MSSQTLITYEFKITGMTCVACSSAIEKGIIEAFKDKGLLSKGINNDKFEVTVILLMHKMKCTF